MVNVPFTRVNELTSGPNLGENILNDYFNHKYSNNKVAKKAPEVMDTSALSVTNSTLRMDSNEENMRNDQIEPLIKEQVSCAGDYREKPRKRS